MYIPRADNIVLFQKPISDKQRRPEYQTGIDLDAVLGDIETCMQSPECTDHSTPPASH